MHHLDAPALQALNLLSPKKAQDGPNLDPEVENFLLPAPHTLHRKLQACSMVLLLKRVNRRVTPECAATCDPCLDSGSNMSVALRHSSRFLVPRYPENLAQLLPPETVRFRLRHWLRDGCEIVRSSVLPTGYDCLAPATSSPWDRI